MVKSDFWDVGEEFTNRPPNLGKASTAKVMQALVKLGGRLHDSCICGDDNMPDHQRDVVYRISLPFAVSGAYKTRFEEMTGYILTKPTLVKAS